MQIGPAAFFNLLGCFISWSEITRFGNRGGLSTWVHIEKVLFVLHIIQTEHAQRYFSQIWQSKFFLIVKKNKEWVTCHFSVSFSYFSCYFTMENKQIINHSQKEQIFDISFHTLHIATALLCVGDFFIWMEIYLIQSTGKFAFHFYSIAGITVMVWNRHKLGNTY